MNEIRMWEKAKRRIEQFEKRGIPWCYNCGKKAHYQVTVTDDRGLQFNTTLCEECLNFTKVEGGLDWDLENIKKLGETTA